MATTNSIIVIDHSLNVLWIGFLAGNAPDSKSDARGASEQSLYIMRWRAWGSYDRNLVILRFNTKDHLAKTAYALTHCDLNIVNVMVKDGQLVVDILDWEHAAYYPV